MISKCRAIWLLLGLSILFWFESGSGHAQEKPITHEISKNGNTMENGGINNNFSLYDIRFKEIQRTILLNEERTEDRIKELEELVTAQRDTINDLKAIADKPLSDGITFEVWSGILLACVAVLVTVLGVVVALLSLFGYKELIEKGTESASLVAAKQTKAEFDSFIAQGRLDNVITESINKIVYRGFSPNPRGNELESEDNE